LLALRWFLEKKTFENVFILKITKRISSLSDKKLIPIIFLLIVVVLITMSIARHLSFSSGAFDLGIFDQAIWNTTKGNILVSSLKGNMNLLGDHFEPMLLLIVPFYFLWSSPIVLLILQSIALGLSVFPLYLIARQRLNERFLIFALLISFFLSKGLRGVGLNDFHLEGFIVPLIFLCYYLLITRKTAWFFVSTFFLLLCKEDMALMVSAFGIFTFFIEKRRPLGIILFLGAIAAWILETKIIIPHFNPQGVYPYLTRLPFGDTYVQNIKFVLANPFSLLKLVFHPQNVEFYLKLFGSLGFLSLFSPARLILIAIPLFKIAMGLNTPEAAGMAYMHSHHIGHLLPFVYIAAIYGVGWIVDKLSKKVFSRKMVANFLSAYIIIVALGFCGKMDGYKFMKYIKHAEMVRAGKIRQYLRPVPDDASVATNSSLFPHLSHRKYIFLWNPDEAKSNLAQYLVIDKKMLDYILPEKRSGADDFLTRKYRKKYKEVFSNEDNSFVILLNKKANDSSIDDNFASQNHKNNKEDN
jgi:uncharacterized membrane protein